MNMPFETFNYSTNLQIFRNQIKGMNSVTESNFLKLMKFTLGTYFK